MKYINMFECQIQGLEDNIKLCDTLYPGWQVSYSQSNGRKAETKLTKHIFQLRVYHDLSPTDPLMENLCRFNTPFLILPRFHHFWKSFLARSHFYSKVSFTSIDCRLSCKYRSLDLCDVRNLPSSQVRQSIPSNQVLSRIDHLGCSANIVHLNQSIFSRGLTNFRTITLQIGDPVKLFPMLWRFFPTLDPQVPISHNSTCWRKFPRWKSSSAGHQDQYSGSKKICQKQWSRKIVFFSETWTACQRGERWQQWRSGFNLGKRFTPWETTHIIGKNTFISRTGFGEWFRNW